MDCTPVVKSAKSKTSRKKPAKPAKRAAVSKTRVTKANAGSPPNATPRHAKKIYRELLKQYAQAHCALDHKNPYELLIATILSAQCTDVRVNMVTPGLFRQYPTPAAMADARLSDVEEAVRTTGFYRNKAKNIQGASRIIEDQHRGQVPRTMEELTRLPGVARKTANVVLGNAFDTNVGVVVDTHVSRLSRRLGLTKHTDPKKIEQDLMTLIPRDQWTMLAHLLIHHGRAICNARKPQCDGCSLAKLCPQIGVSG